METNKTNIFYDFLQTIPYEDKELMLRAMSDHEIMENCSSEEEYRMITGEEMPMDFAAYRPDRAKDAAPVGEPEVSENSLKERLKEIKKEFVKKPSMDRLKKLAENEGEMPEPMVAITINLGQLKEKAANLSKSKS